MVVSKAQKRATAKFEAKKYDHIMLRVPKGDREKIQAAATACNLSVNSFIRTAINEKIRRENCAGTNNENSEKS